MSFLVVVIIMITLGLYVYVGKKIHHFLLSDLAAGLDVCGGFVFSAVVDFDIVAALDLCKEIDSIRKISHFQF